ncbi:MAG TPA: hypothetical protein VJ841_00495 [Candidatus Saccharimonadales bacterium]|nr:hypothetical protein [Candidatus Saccharimonadales bacterium]
MAEIKSFIADARSKGLSDEEIRSALIAQDWDPAVVNAELVGISVPKPSSATQPSARTQAVATDHHPSLSPLMAAIHHILLWFFIGSSTVTIAGTVSSLFGTNVSSEALAAMIAVTVVTFVPYAILFLLYLLRMRKTPDLIPGKVWSIITICLHSIGAMIAAITLIINLITVHEMTVTVSAALILVLDALVIKVYAFAAFGMKFKHYRRFVTIAYLPVLIVFFGVLLSMSIFKLGPAQHDKQLRQSLETSVHKIADYTQKNKKLPAAGSDVSLESGVRYERLSDKTYKVCGTFQSTNEKNTSDFYYSEPADQGTDAYVSDSDFDNAATGEKCFEFTSAALSETHPVSPLVD